MVAENHTHHQRDTKLLRDVCEQDGVSESEFSSPSHSKNVMVATLTRTACLVVVARSFDRHKDVLRVDALGETDVLVFGNSREMFTTQEVSVGYKLGLCCCCIFVACGNSTACTYMLSFV
jgi:hypothetical protein